MTRNQRCSQYPYRLWTVWLFALLPLVLMSTEVRPALSAPNLDSVVCDPGYKMYPPTEECIPEDDPRLVPAAFIVTSWVCPANIVDRDEWAGRCTRSFEGLRLMHNRNSNYVATTFGSNVIEMNNLTAGLFKLDVDWSGVETYPTVMTDCTDALTGFAYRTRLEPDGSMQMTLEGGSNWACSFYLMPTNTNAPLAPIGGPDDSIEIPQSMIAKLQIAVRHCDGPVDDVRAAYDQCAVNERDTLANATSEFNVIDGLGTEQSQSQLGAVTYEFSGIQAGTITITPSYPQRTDVTGTLFDCVDGASNDQGATIGFVALGEAFTLQAERGSRFMCSAYVSPTEGENNNMSGPQDDDSNDVDPAVDQEFGTLTVNLVACPHEFSAEGIGSLAEGLDGCDLEAPQTSASLISADDDVDASFLLGADDPTSVSETNVPVGTYELRIFPPMGGFEGTVFCGIDSSAGDNEPFAILAGVETTCTIFIILPEEEDPPFLMGGVGTIEITVAACPSGIDAIDFDNPTVVIAECDQPTQQTNVYILDDEGDVFDTRGIGGDEPGTSTFDEVPIGNYSLEGTLLPAYARATLICDADGTTWTDGSLEVFEGDTTTCYVILTLAGGEGPAQDPADDETEDDDTVQPNVTGYTVTFDAQTCAVLPSPTAPPMNCWPGLGVEQFDFSITVSASDGDGFSAEVVLNPSLNSAADAEDRTFADVPIGTSFQIGAANPAALSELSVKCLQVDTGAVVDVDPSVIAAGKLFDLDVEGPTEITCLVSLVILGDPDAGSETAPADDDDPAELDDSADGEEGAIGSVLVFIKGCAEGVTHSESDVFQNAIDTCTEDAPSTTVNIYDSDGELMYGGYSGDYGLNSVPNEIVFVGTYTLAVVLPDGYALALPYCWQEAVSEDTVNGTGGPGAATNPDVFNASASDAIVVIEDMRTTCYIYLVPVEDEEDVSVEPGEPNASDSATGAIDVNVAGCEAGFVPTDEYTSKMLYSHCSDVVPGVTVEIYDATGAIAYSGDGSPTLTIPDAAAGTYTLGIVLAGEYDGFTARCSGGSSTSGNTIEVVIGGTAWCDVYLTTGVAPGEPAGAGETGAIVLSVLGCPEGVTGDSVDEAAASCLAPVPAAVITLVDANGAVLEASPEMLAGLYTVNVQFPEGYDGFTVHCDGGTSNNTIEVVAASTTACTIYLTRELIIG